LNCYQNLTFYQITCQKSGTQKFKVTKTFKTFFPDILSWLVVLAVSQRC